MSALGRLTLAAAAVLVLLALIPSNVRATGQTYTVVQCHPLNRAHANAILEDASPYAARAFCGDPQNDYAIKVTSTGGAQHGSFGRVRWSTGSPALGIVSVDVRAKLRRDNSHKARLWMADPNLNEVARVATGDKGATAYRHYGWDAGGHGLRQFVASLSCERPAGCSQSNAAKTWVRDVRLNVADYSDPRFSGLSAGRSWGAVGFAVRKASMRQADGSGKRTCKHWSCHGQRLTARRQSEESAMASLAPTYAVAIRGMQRTIYSSQSAQVTQPARHFTTAGTPSPSALSTSQVISDMRRATCPRRQHATRDRVHQPLRIQTIRS